MDTNTTNQSEKTLVIYEPDEEVIEMYKDYILSKYNTDFIRELMMSGFHSILMNRDVKVEGNIKNSNSNDLVKLYKEKNGAVKKNIMAALMGIFMSDIRNMMHYMETLPKDVLKVMELVSRNHVVSSATLEKETGKSWLVKSSLKYGPSYRKSPELVWIDCTSGICDKTTEDAPYEREYYFHFDLKFRPLFMPFFIPKDKLLTSLSETLPDTPEEPLTIFNVEKELFTEIPILDGLYRQGSFCLTENRKLPVNVMKKLATQMKLREFYPDGGKETTYLRASMLMPYFNTFMTDRKEIVDHPEKIIKEVFQQKLLIEPSFLLSTVLPHITGFKGLTIRNAFNHQDVLEFCGFMFDRVRSNRKGWIDFDQLLNSMMLAGDSVSIFSYYLLGDSPIFNKIHNRPVYLEDTFEEISVAFFKGFLFLMGTFGLIEIAHKPYEESDPSPFSSLRYFRLTDLGLYVFGFYDSYSLPEVENKELYFKLDDKNLIALSLIDDNPYESLLAGMSEPIGNKRYKVSLDSMLKNCTTREEVVNKIDFFKRFICKKLPEVWEDFFKSLVDRCEPLTQLKSHKYCIYQLDPANEELMHLLATDPVIKKYARRVEGHMLLVEATGQKKLAARLKILGYLL